MKNSTFTQISLFILLPLTAFAQTIGTAKAPDDLLKATLLIERAESKISTKYVPFGVFKKEAEKTIQVSPTNLVVAVDQPETIFHAAGSGVLLTISNVNLCASSPLANETPARVLPQPVG